MSKENKILRGIRMLGRHFLVYVTMPTVHALSSRAYLQHLPDFIFPDQSLFRSLLANWERGRTGNNRGDYVRLLLLIANIRLMEKNGVDGHIAELGVYKGNSAKVFRELMPSRKLYLFDTFEGFSEADTQSDPSGIDGGHYACGLAPVKQFVGEADNVVYCVGRFPATAHLVQPDDRFALVHLDCDLYEPTRAALEFFYPRMSPGGLIVVHDYFSGGWPGVTQAVDEFLQERPEGIVVIPDKSGTAVIPVKAA